MAGCAITTLAGGIGGARFLRGLRAELAARGEPLEITVVGNTADDIELFGLHVCPDLDTVMYTLGGGIHEEQGWGRADETFAVKDELAAYGAEPQWFGLGDRDIATHLVRTQMLDAGYPLSQVTEALCARWQPGVRLLPMTDDRVETHVVVEDEHGRRAVHFQEWWVRMHAATPAIAIVAGRRGGRPAGPRRARGDRRGRRRAAAAVQPGRVDRHDPRGARDPRRGRRDRGAGRRRLADHRRRAGARDGRRVPGRDRRRDDAPAAVARLYTGLLDGWLVDDADAGTSVDGVVVRALDLLHARRGRPPGRSRPRALDLAAELRVPA